MKTRTIITLTVLALVFTVLAFQLQKEAAAETQSSNIYLSIESTDGQNHGPYVAQLINATTGQVILDLPGQEIGGYPSIHGGTGSFPTNIYFKIRVCSNQNWGETSPQFKIKDGENVNMTIVVHRNCPMFPAVED